MLARGGEIIADDATKVTFEELGPYKDTNTTGKPMANVTRYTYTDGDDSYVVTFTRYRDLAADKLIDTMHGPKMAARLLRFDGAICGSLESCASSTGAQTPLSMVTQTAPSGN